MRFAFRNSVRLVSSAAEGPGALLLDYCRRGCASTIFVLAAANGMALC